MDPGFGLMFQKAWMTPNHHHSPQLPCRETMCSRTQVWIEVLNSRENKLIVWLLCNFYLGISSIVKLKVSVKGTITLSAAVGSFICMLLNTYLGILWLGLQSSILSLQRDLQTYGFPLKSIVAVSNDCVDIGCLILTICFVLTHF